MLNRYIAVVLLLVAGSAWAQLTPEEQAAKAKGLMFFQLHKRTAAIPELRIAAEAGDIEAQYFLAESLRLNAPMHITAESQKWYEAAAEQGEVYAMLRLSSKGDDLCVAMANCPADQKTPYDWLKQARETAGARAAKGDALAMMQMNNTTADIAWLEKSAEAGFGEGQYWLAVSYRQNEGWFLLPGSREEAVEKWFRASAESGYPPGMMNYAEILYKRKELEPVRYWVKKAAESGYIKAVFSYASYVAHMPDKLNYSLDRVTGYGLISLIAKLDGGGGSALNAQEFLPEIAAKMTPDEIKQAKTFAEEWQKTHPPLSYFVDKYGY